MIIQFMNSLARNNVGGRTANQALSILSVGFDAAIEAGLIQNNPTDGVSNAPVRNKPINPLTELEVRTLLTNSKGTYMLARLHMAFNGLRQGEVIGLRWSDINFDGGELLLKEQIQKVHKVARRVPLKSKSSVRSLALSKETISASTCFFPIKKSTPQPPCRPLAQGWPPSCEFHRWEQSGSRY